MCGKKISRRLEETDENYLGVGRIWQTGQTLPSSYSRDFDGLNKLFAMVYSILALKIVYQE
jgi:hypothetical protein